MVNEKYFLWKLQEFLEELDDCLVYRKIIIREFCHSRGSDFNREVLEEHFDEIISYIDSHIWSHIMFGKDPTDISDLEDIEEMTIKFYYVLGILILHTGAILPDRVKNVILKKELDWFEAFESFREAIKNYVPGNPLMQEIRDNWEAMGASSTFVKGLSHFWLQHFNRY